MSQTNSYIDAKGRKRFHRNDWLAEKLGELHDLLVIGGYDESHAARYPKLGYAISRFPESIDTLVAEDRLHEIPGIGPIVQEIITQFLATATCDKFDEWTKITPVSVLEVAAIPRLGAKMVRTLYTQYKIVDLKSLKAALERGELDATPGIGPKMRQTMKAFVDEKQVS